MFTSKDIFLIDSGTPIITFSGVNISERESTISEFDFPSLSCLVINPQNHYIYDFAVANLRLTVSKSTFCNI